MIHSKRLNHSEIKQVAVFMNGSLNHWLKWFIQNGWSIQKWSKWLSLWMDHWIIDSNDSFKKWLSLWIDHWIIDSNDSFKMSDSFRNEASGCLYEWIIESLTQMIHSKRLIHSEMKQVAVFMNGSLNHWLKWFIQNGWFIQKLSKWLSLWMDHWIIDSNDSFKTADSFRNEASGCLYEWIIESLTQMIHSKQMIHSEMKQVAVFMNGSLNHWLKWFVQKQIHLGNKHCSVSLELFSLENRKNIQYCV